MRSAAVLAIAASGSASGCLTAIHVSQHATAASAAQAPGFSLVAQDGHAVALADALAAGPVVLVFYRGFW